MKSNTYATLTPYLIPPALQSWKMQNLGDGFILKSIERLMGPFDQRSIFPARAAPPADFDFSNGVVIAGANLLDDKFRPWPGISADEIRAKKMRIIPFGVGIHGDQNRNAGFSPETLEILRAMHEQIEYSSWRCVRTYNLLKQELPELEGKILMTGCPVVYDRPLLESTSFHNHSKRVAVTVTERGDFWERETQTIDFVSSQFKNAKKYLVLHQNFSPAHFLEPINHRFFPKSLEEDPAQALRHYARKRGFKIVCPPSPTVGISFYKKIDLHIGSRLHAHLHLLSQNKRSFLCAVDDRARGMSETFGFPICPPDKVADHMNFDFEEVRSRAQSLYRVMKQFLGTVR